MKLKDRFHFQVNCRFTVENDRKVQFLASIDQIRPIKLFYFAMYTCIKADKKFRGFLFLSALALKK